MSNDYDIVVFEKDTVELLLNDQLSNRPYLLRFTNDYNERYEMRCGKDELKWLSEFLSKQIGNT